MSRPFWGEINNEKFGKCCQFYTYSDNVLGSRVLQLSGDLLRLVGGVDGGDGQAGPDTAQEGDGELRDVGEEKGHHVGLLGSHPAESRAELDGRVPGHLVGVLAASHPTAQGRQVSVLINIGEHKVGHVLLGNVNVRVGTPIIIKVLYVLPFLQGGIYLIMNSSSSSSMTPEGTAGFFL